MKLGPAFARRVNNV